MAAHMQMLQGCSRVVLICPSMPLAGSRPGRWRWRLDRFDRVIASPLVRARQTATAFDAPCILDERWIELDYGDFEGRPMSDIGADVWGTWRNDSAFVPPGGESLDSLDLRVRSACRDLLEVADDEVVVIVSHVSPIKAALAWALDGHINMSWRCHLEQASVSPRCERTVWAGTTQLQ